MSPTFRYASKRKRNCARRKRNTARFSTAAPKWVCDVETLRFRAVNGTAVLQYPYSRDEFLRMPVNDICPREGIPAFAQVVRDAAPDTVHVGFCKHQNKDGALIDVDETIHILMFQGRLSGLVVAQDVTERRLEEAARQKLTADHGRPRRLSRHVGVAHPIASKANHSGRSRAQGSRCARRIARCGRLRTGSRRGGGMPRPTERSNGWGPSY
jgi:PAS domain S-box-containing protein